MSSTLFDKHRAMFERAQIACTERHCWSPFPEMPSKYPDAVAAQAAALVRFQAQIDRPFVLDQPGLRSEPGHAGARHGGRADRQAAGAAPEDRHRRLHRQRALRPMGGAQRPPGAGVHRDRRLQHRGAGVGRRPGRRAAQPGHHDVHVQRADVHQPAEHLRAAAGVRTPQGTVPLDDVARRLAEAVAA